MDTVVLSLRLLFLAPYALLRVVVVALPPLSPNQQSLLRRLFPPSPPPSRSPLPFPPPRPLRRDSNAADIRPGSRPFYVNHVVKDPTPPLDLEEDRRTCRASSKGRRRGTTLKRTTALIAGEIRVPQTRCQSVYFEYRFLFSFILSFAPLPSPFRRSSPFFILFSFSFFRLSFFLLLLPLVPPVRCSVSFVRLRISAPLALLASSMVLILRSKRAPAR